MVIHRNELSTEAQQFSRITLITTILFIGSGLVSTVLGLLFQSPIAGGLGAVRIRPGRHRHAFSRWSQPQRCQPPATVR